MTNLRKAAEMAWNYFRNAEDITVEGKQVMEALRQALEQPEQKPVGTYEGVMEAMLSLRHGTIEQLQVYGHMKDKLLYAAPPKREWVGLTDAEIDIVFDKHFNRYAERNEAWPMYERELEAKLKEKNT